MNRFLGFSSLGVSLLALGVALWGPQGESAAASSSSSEVSTPSRAPDAKALEQRVKALEENATSLSRRLMVLEQRSGSVPTGSGVAGDPASLAVEVAQLRAEVRGLTGGQPWQSEAGRQSFKDMLRSVQEDMRAEQRELHQQRAAQFQAQTQAQRAERVRQFASSARLSSSQEQELTRQLQGEETQRQAIMESVRSGEKSPQEVRQALRQLREQTDKDVRTMLDESQQAQYDELRRQDLHPARAVGPGGPGDMP